MTTFTVAVIQSFSRKLTAENVIPTLLSSQNFRVLHLQALIAITTRFRRVIVNLRPNRTTWNKDETAIIVKATSHLLGQEVRVLGRMPGGRVKVSVDGVEKSYLPNELQKPNNSDNRSRMSKLKFAAASPNAALTEYPALLQRVTRWMACAVDRAMAPAPSLGDLMNFRKELKDRALDATSEFTKEALDDVEGFLKYYQHGLRPRFATQVPPFCPLSMSTPT